MRLARRRPLVLILQLHGWMSQGRWTVSKTRDRRGRKLRATRDIALLLGRAGAFLVGLRRMRRLLHLLLDGRRFGLLLLAWSTDLIFRFLRVVLDERVQVGRLLIDCVVELTHDRDSWRRTVPRIGVACTRSQRRQLWLLLRATEGTSL